MPVSTAQVATTGPAHATRQLVVQLVSHLCEEAVTELAADGRGIITFRQGTCVLAPFGHQLDLIAAAADHDALAGVQRAVTRHLHIASGAELPVDWTEPAAGEDLDLLHPLLGDYLLGQCTPADEVLQELVAETREATGRAAGMQISQDEGAFLAMLVQLVGARNAVEVGVFTGYSSLCIARALPEGGRLLACDVNDDWAAIARRYWERAGVADRIDLKVGPAIDTLRALPAEPAIDIAFIDADKVGYRAYYEEIVQRLRPGGLVVLDNVFLGGRVLDPAYQGEDHVAMRSLNELIVADDRVDSVMLAVRDGVTLARRR
ncbi:caffeoyl-CoA O-methyltransferase [Kitasatospora sp. MAA4]|uniref:DUF2218 domain-containing protein n=1 Tax=Kitasatospora sp. MAA4 TaxID=3035093 RepID=UPI0024764F25|nr:DUF2218 domain-containing protein [Kitasatospora sp. MAA4]MDH6132713.1 caffeoyl-CoA O-methyltransferase [Kitasatospora sp. MAA4]